MEANFWHDKWQRGEIGFHEGEANDLLVRHFKSLNLEPGSRIFLPLCGKTVDIAWLLDKGFEVVGSELSELAIRDLFSDLGVAPRVQMEGAFKVFRAPGIEILVGDFFDLTSEILGQVDAVYDRAALVALPLESRKAYTALLRKLSENAPQLLITFAYDQSRMNGPPFSVDEPEVKQHYDEAFQLTAAERKNLPNGLKGKVAAIETAWLLE